MEQWSAYLAHNQGVVGSSPSLATMEKRISFLKSSTLRDLATLMNNEKIVKEDVVQFICTAKGEYIVMLYK